MQISDTRRMGLVIGLTLAIPLAALLLMRQFEDALDPLLMYPTLHFWSTGVTALGAAALCGVVIASAKTLRETKLLFLALAFLCIAGIFSVHGLLTPGFIKHDFHEALAVSSWISLIAGAGFAAMSAVDLPRPVDRVVRRAGLVIFAWVAIAVGLYVALSMTVVTWLDDVPTDNRDMQFAIGAVTTSLILFALYRYYQAWYFARLPSQAVMACSLALLAGVPPILLWGEVWHLSWWSYHLLYGLGMAVLFGGWAIEWRRAGSLSAIAEALSMRDAVALLSRGRDADVVELVDAIEAKDLYTVGHVHRVGSIAFEIGKTLGLNPAQMRELVLAAQMHDVGKIWTPDAVLQKPDGLTAEETLVMREHATRGGEIASRVGALHSAAPSVRAHHERFDGGGYPDGLRGEEIPLAARIVSVADTYDAMTTARPYRAAMPHESAITEIRRVRGTQLDPRCVDAFLATFATERRAA